MKRKKNKMQTNKYTRVIREHSISKPATKVSMKRIMMLTRRLNILMLEKTSLEQKNKEILDSLKSEKLLSASLRKESFYWQRLYHEADLTINSYKVKQTDLVQAMTSCLRDTDALYPHMVALSDKVTNNKIKLTSALNSIRTTDHGLPRHIIDKEKENESTSANVKPKYHHRVGPMVGGMLITKPKIMLERVMLPPPQEQEQESPNNDPTMMEGSNNNLTPIAEENEHSENLELGSVTIRTRPRHKLGKGWRVRRQAQLEREAQRGTSTPAGVTYNDESSDTECIIPTMNHMEPVVRIRDVSRLLQNSSLLKMDGRPNDGDGGGKINIKRTSTMDDPMEGSSWMFSNNIGHHNKFTSASPKCTMRRSSIYKPDSSDDEEDNVIEARNISNISTVNSLVMRNPSKNVNPSSEKASLNNQNENNADTSMDSTNAEPDSTNNIDDHQFSNSSDNSGESSSSYCISGNGLLAHSNNSNIALNILVDTDERMKSNVNSPTVRLSNVLQDSSSLLDSNRKSYCNNCSPMINSPDLGKRIRKPKQNLYPGEEEFCQIPKAKFIVGKKTSYQNIKSKSRKSIERRSSSTTGRPSGGESHESSKKKKSNSHKKTKGQSNSESGSEKKNNRLSSPVNLSRGKSSESSTIKTKKKEASTVSTVTKKNNKSSSKRSLYTSRTSSYGNVPSRPNSPANQGAETSRPRRTKSVLSYKESPLNLKQRRV